jgi:hypothetical protein
LHQEPPRPIPDVTAPQFVNSQECTFFEPPGGESPRNSANFSVTETLSLHRETATSGVMGTTWGIEGCRPVDPVVAGSSPVALANRKGHKVKTLWPSSFLRFVGVLQHLGAIWGQEAGRVGDTLKPGTPCPSCNGTSTAGWTRRTRSARRRPRRTWCRCARCGPGPWASACCRAPLLPLPRAALPQGR